MRLDITSEKFPGWVEMPDVFGWPETLAYYALMRAQRGLDPEDAFYAILPGMIKIVKEWHIEGFPEKPEVPTDIPCRPFRAVIVVLNQIFKYIIEAATAENDVPLLSSPKRTVTRKAKGRATR